MLNELYLLKNGIEEVNQQALKPPHPSIGEPGKANLIKVMLSKQKIIELDVLDDGKNKNYWTRGDGNQNQFPAVKIPFPIRSGGVKEFREWKKGNQRPSSEQLAECLERLRAKHPVSIDTHQCWPKYREKLAKQETIYARLQGDARIIHKLINTYLSFEKDGLSLLERFDESLWEEYHTTPDKKLLDLLALAMFAEGQQLNQDGIINGKRITLLLDVQGDSTYSAAHRHWVSEVSELLYQQEGKKSGRIGTCAISGSKNEKLVSGAFPEAKCPILGNVKIFSRKKETHTYQRYRKREAESYPLSEELSVYLSSALQHCTDEARKGKTWDTLPKENGGTNDLLIAFCRAFSDIEIASLVTYSNNEFFNETEYESESEQICKSFKGEDTVLSAEPRVDFLVLRKINEGVRKAIFSLSSPVSQLEKASQDWKEACKNTPPIMIKIRRKNSKQLIDCSPKPISPKQFILLFRKNYTRSKLQNKKCNTKLVPGLAFAGVMELFLGVARTTDLANQFLQKLLKQFASLLEKIALEKSKQLKDDSMIKYHFDALHAVVAISLLLKKLGRSKEAYMKDLSYKLGQFCAALDKIHIGYCTDKRIGQIPNRLIGNQAYATAVLNPQKALELIAQRIAVYIAWAKKNSERNDNELKKRGKDLKSEEKEDDYAYRCLKNAKFTYFWLGNNCAEIHQLIPDEIPLPTPKSKAELLLGYLADLWPAHKKKQDEVSKTGNL